MLTKQEGALKYDMKDREETLFATFHFEIESDRQTARAKNVSEMNYIE